MDAIKENAMTLLSAPEVTVSVYTFKEGLAARMGHDLKIIAHAVRCTLEPATTEPFRIDAQVDPRELRVECAQVNGHDDHAALSAGDRSKINAHIQDDVLHTRKHSTIRFVSTRVTATRSGYDVHGDLTLTGCTRPVVLHAERQGDRHVARVQINQPDFGIKPFAAPLGILKVKPQVVVEVSLPADIAMQT